MILRLLNFAVIGVLVLAAAWVYRIKFDATVQAERSIERARASRDITVPTGTPATSAIS